MQDDRPVRAGMLGGDPAQRAHWRERISQANGGLRAGNLVLLSEADTHIESADVLLVLGDMLLAEALAQRAIRIGDTGPAAVQLPADVGPEVVQLALLLLGQAFYWREESLRRQLDAEADWLTGLANRRAWDRKLSEEIASTSGASAPLWVALLDLDHFKRINDAQGHAVGDRVLAAVGQWLRDRIPPMTFAARLGGDEFALLARIDDAEAPAAWIEHLRGMLCDELHAAGLPATTASAGWVTYRGPPLPANPHEMASQLERAADAALLAAKRAGRNQSRAAG